MISFDQAQSLILEHSESLPIITLPFTESTGYFLSKPLVATCDSPLFDQSAVDGYAVRSEDIRTASADSPATLRLIGEVAAGSQKVPTIRERTTIRVLTGGQIPRGADAVVMKEYCVVEQDFINITVPARPEDNIRFRGEEFRKGAGVLETGTWITPPVVGMMAGFGMKSVSVRRPPRIALVVTGNEVLPPDQKLKKGQIHDSNSYSIKAALQRIGITEVHVSYSPDDEARMKDVLKDAERNADVVMTIGGVSVGEYDLVKELLNQSGVETVFWRVAVKPGMPLFFGIKKSRKGPRKLFFGLPGNPVSALLLYQLLVVPALKKMMGNQKCRTLTLDATLRGKLKKKPGRLEWVRANLLIEGSTRYAIPLSGQGSHMLGGFAQSNCLIRFPESESHLSEGSTVDVVLLNW